jgi:hypothetical protein
MLLSNTLFRKCASQCKLIANVAMVELAQQVLVALQLSIIGMVPGNFKGQWRMDYGQVRRKHIQLGWVNELPM